MIKAWNLLLVTIGVAGGFNNLLKLDEYHSHEQLTAFLKNFTSANSDLTKLCSIGKSFYGRDLWVLEISATKDTYLRPNIKLIGNIHGNEPVGRELLLHFSMYLVTKYREGDVKVRGLLDFARFHILPSMNPDGFWSATNHSTPGGHKSCQTGPGRNNMLDINLNRNFPDYFRSNNQPIQLETMAVMKWMQDVPFVLSASLHGGSLVASYPYDNNKQSNPGEPSLTPDDDVFKHLANVYSQKHPSMHKGEACPRATNTFANGITNGAAWYPLTGGMQDYNYLAHGCMELTLEISCCKFPKASELPKYWEENREALLTYVEEVRRGIRGVVVDESGAGVPNATLRILGRDVPFHTTAKGEFWRILLPNVYFLHVEADGFINQTLPIKINSPSPLKWSQFLNITLQRTGSQQTPRNQLTWTNASLPKEETQEEFFSSSMFPTDNFIENNQILENHKSHHLTRDSGEQSKSSFGEKTINSCWMFIFTFSVFFLR